MSECTHVYVCAQGKRGGDGMEGKTLNGRSGGVQRPPLRGVIYGALDKSLAGVSINLSPRIGRPGGTLKVVGPRTRSSRHQDGRRTSSSSSSPPPLSPPRAALPHLIPLCSPLSLCLWRSQGVEKVRPRPAILACPLFSDDLIYIADPVSGKRGPLVRCHWAQRRGRPG